MASPRHSQSGSKRTLVEASSSDVGDTTTAVHLKAIPESQSLCATSEYSSEVSSSMSTVPSSTSASPAKKRGVFLVFEGIDRSGKSTQSAKLQQYLEATGAEFKFIRFPDRSSATGKVIDAYLKSDEDLDDRAVHLLFSANRHAMRAEMERLLISGCHVICDRYADSGAAYTYAKNRVKGTKKATQTEEDTGTAVAGAKSSSDTLASGTAALSELSWQFCTSSDEGLIAPDKVVLMDLSVTDAKSRGHFGEERYERVEMLSAVAAAYRQLVDRNPTHYTVLDATGDIKTLHESVLSIFEKTVRKCEMKPISYLHSTAAKLY